eukprot:11748223-Alexandrium_andersonii.AAC.1
MASVACGACARLHRVKKIPTNKREGCVAMVRSGMAGFASFKDIAGPGTRHGHLSRPPTGPSAKKTCASRSE